jgi:hypothetical protein
MRHVKFNARAAGGVLYCAVLVLRLAVKEAEESHEDNLNEAFQDPYWRLMGLNRLKQSRVDSLTADKLLTHWQDRYGSFVRR